MDGVKKMISEEQIGKIVDRMAAQINEDFLGEDLLVIGILKGASLFMADLIRKIKLPLEIDYMAVSSYGSSTRSSGVVRILKDLEADIQGKSLLIVEDIVDTGLTLSYLKNNLLSRKAKSVKIASLLNKPSRRKIDIEIDYVGKEIEDYFVVGYGIDYAEKYRNLPYIAIYEGDLL